MFEQKVLPLHPTLRTTDVLGFSLYGGIRNTSRNGGIGRHEGLKIP